MRLSSVLISSYKCWQENKDARTLLYFYKRFAWKKNLRHVISFFFFPPLPGAVSWRPTPHLRGHKGRRFGSAGHSAAPQIGARPREAPQSDRLQPAIHLPPVQGIHLPQQPQLSAAVPQSLPLELCHATSPSSTNLIWIGRGHMIMLLSN